MPTDTEEGWCFSTEDHLPLTELRRRLRVFDEIRLEIAAEDYCIIESQNVFGPIYDVTSMQLLPQVYVQESYVETKRVLPIATKETSTHLHEALSYSEDNRGMAVVSFNAS